MVLLTITTAKFVDFCNFHPSRNLRNTFQEGATSKKGVGGMVNRHCVSKQINQPRSVTNRRILVHNKKATVINLEKDHHLIVTYICLRVATSSPHTEREKQRTKRRQWENLHTDSISLCYRWRTILHADLANVIFSQIPRL